MTICLLILFLLILIDCATDEDFEKKIKKHQPKQKVDPSNSEK